MALLQVRDVSCAKDKERNIFSHITFDVNEGDVIILQGKSGSGYVSDAARQRSSADS